MQTRTTTSIALFALTAAVACDPTGDDPPPMSAETGEVESQGSTGAAEGDGSTSGGADESTGDPGETTGGHDLPTEQDPSLAELTDMLNAECGTEIITTIDWPSYEAHYGEGPVTNHDYGEGEAINYCSEILGAIEFDCRSTEGVAEAFAGVGLTQIHCYWHEDLPTTSDVDTRENMIMEITDGAQTWGMNWWTANINQQVYGWLDSL